MTGLTRSGPKARGGVPQTAPAGHGRAQSRPRANGHGSGGHGSNGHGPNGSGHGSNGEVGLLLAAVEREVIPRLVREHAPRPSSRARPGLSDVERLAGLALDGLASEATDLVDHLRVAGVPLTSIYTDLLGAAARLLGEMWEQDRVNFVDVTVGLCTLHQVLFRIGTDMVEGIGGEDVGRILLAPVPGETHVFGALIVARFFARAGWRTWTELDASEAELNALIAKHKFDVIGLSLSCDREPDELRDLIARMRTAALPAKPQIFIGGGAVERMPGLVGSIGADRSSTDPTEAVRMAAAVRNRHGGLD